jgi:hypothetical protein
MEPDSFPTIQSANEALLLTGQYSDVTFVVGEGNQKEEIRAHKFILMTRSSVFAAMFQRWETKDDCRIEISDVDARIFREFLTFLYTNKFMTNFQEAEQVILLAHRYLLSTLEVICATYMLSRISFSNALHLFELAMYLDHKMFMDRSREFIYANALQVFSSSSFVKIKMETLHSLIEADGLDLSEVDVFRAVMRWAEHACRKQHVRPTPRNKRRMIRRIIPLIRFPLMTPAEFAEEVTCKNSGLLTDAETIHIFTYITAGPKLKSKLNPGLFNPRPRNYAADFYMGPASTYYVDGHVSPVALYYI